MAQFLTSAGLDNNFLYAEVGGAFLVSRPHSRPSALSRSHPVSNAISATLMTRWLAFKLNKKTI